jgi:hypothetical protein
MLNAKYNNMQANEAYNHDNDDDNKEAGQWKGSDDIDDSKLPGN